MTSLYDHEPAQPGDVVVHDCNPFVMRGLHNDIRDSGTQVLAGNLPTLIVNERHLTQLFHHLLDNAIRFRGVAPPHVTIRARQCGECWELSVADNGVGLASELGNTAYELFSRAEGHRHLPGTGLGLAVCAHIARLYGGEIRHYHNDEAGTTFVVSLPVAQAPPSSIELDVRCNGKPVGKVSVASDADKDTLTRIALALPELSKVVGNKSP